MRRLLPLLLLALLVAAPAQAASPFAPLDRAAKTSKPPKQTKAAIRAAKRAHARGRTCAAVKALGRIDRPAKVVVPARQLQRRLFRTQAKKGACGLRKPRFRVTSAVKPDVASLGAGRPVARIDNGKGTQTDFVANELLVLGRADQAAAFAKRWGGRVLRSAGRTTHLVRVDAGAAKPSGLAGDLRALDPLSRGSFKVSSGAGLDLLALAADAAAHGLKAGPNFLPEQHGFLERTTSEQDGADAYKEPTNGPPLKGHNVGEAWRTMLLAGRLSNRVKVGIVDNGFAMDVSDLQPGATGQDGVGTPGKRCGSGTIECPWHGTNVRAVAAAVPDNGLGMAGTGGPVAQVVQANGGVDTFDMVDAIYETFEAGARVINISMGYELDSTVQVFNVPLEDATQEARERGALVVASAGNEGRDVDAEDCFVACWEEEWIAPCENDAVLCVGGLKPGTLKKDAGSNFGYEWCEDATVCDVDMFAPYSMLVGGDPKVKDPHMSSGTSFSSPFVAGIAALVFAADPSLKPADVEKILRNTARAGGNKYVSRIVDADAAVRRALAFQPLGMATEIVAPAAGAKTLFGGLNALHFEAKAHTLVDPQPGCCSFTWSSDVDGFLGSGPSVDLVFATPGKRTVTVTTKNAAGFSATDAVEVEATNASPSLKVLAPEFGKTYYRGAVYKFEGAATDANELGGAPCGWLTWRVTAPSASVKDLSGCQPTFTFTELGSHQVRVAVDDPNGGSSATTFSVNVVDPPPNSPPLVSILKPDNGAFVDGGDTVQLEASAVDPDGTALTGTWSVIHNGVEKTIGTGNTRTWRPRDQLGNSCSTMSVTLRFTATDADGTSTDEIDMSIGYPAC